MSKNMSLLLTGFVLILSFALVAGCGTLSSGDSTDTRILGLDDIPGGYVGPDLLEITSGTATISLDTGIPTVCNAPFGQTTEYGQVATIPMFDGATLDHVLTFSGLEPDTLYHYQIVLTDIHGNVYRSEDFTFRTKQAGAAASAPDAPVNWLALDQGARVIEVSSNFGGVGNDETWGANSAIDGSLATAWSSDGDGDDAYIVIELSAPIHVERLAVQTRSMANDTAQIFSFAVTNENGEQFGPFDLPDAGTPFEFNVDFNARVLRFDAVQTNGGNTGFVELAAYGTALEDQ